MKEKINLLEILKEIMVKNIKNLSIFFFGVFVGVIIGVKTNGNYVCFVYCQYTPSDNSKKYFFKDQDARKIIERLE